MTLDYRAIVLRETTPAEIVARLYPDGTDRPGFDTSHGAWIGDSSSYTLDIAPYEDGYFNASEGDDGPWIAKELPAHVQVTFVLDKESSEFVDPAVLEKLARLLETGEEDVLFIQNADILLLRRCKGGLTRYRADFWDTMPPEAIPPVFRIPPEAPSE